MFSGFGRAFGPAAAGAAFSWGVARGYVIVAYWFLALTALLGAIPIYMLFDYDALTQTPDASDDEDESVSDEGYVSEGSVVASGSGQGASTETAPLLGAKKGTAGYDAVSPSRS
ncbi:major facilitator superfamily transporter [Colletotrichum tofieldiae]|nr:major facilitator superfamily transporter [Colletotrichum tofieldiae]